MPIAGVPRSVGHTTFTFTDTIPGFSHRMNVIGLLPNVSDRMTEQPHGGSASPSAPIACVPKTTFRGRV